MRRLLAILLPWAALAALFGCAHHVTAYPEQGALERRAIVSYAYIAVQWVTRVDDIEGCKGLVYGCAHVVIDDQGYGHCTIFVFQPEDFNDYLRLAMLGHEFWHCLGARHVE